MAENRHRLGLNITVVDYVSQVMNSLDAYMAVSLRDHLTSIQITLDLETAIVGISHSNKFLVVYVSAGDTTRTYMVIIALFVRPEVGLTRNCCLAIESEGGIKFD